MKGPKPFKLYLRCCYKCNENHRTTTKSHRAICEDCQKELKNEKKTK